MKHKPHPSNQPQEIDEHNWYYENIGRLDLIHEEYNHDGTYLKTEHIKIPMRKIRATIKRIYGIKLVNPNSSRRND